MLLKIETKDLSPFFEKIIATFHRLAKILERHKQHSEAFAFILAQVFVMHFVRLA